MALERTVKLAIIGDAGKAIKSLNRMEGRLGKFGGALKRLGKTAAVGGGALGVGFAAAVGASIKSFAAAGDEVQKMAQRTGLSTEALSEFRHAAELSGSDLGSVEKAVKRMGSTIEDAKDGLSTTVVAMDKLGISADDLAKLDPEAQFLAMAGALADVSDATTRAALAQDVFGRAGTDLLPMLANGSEGLEAMRQEARDLGIVFSQESADKAAEFNDGMQRLGERIAAVKFEIAERVIPVLLQFGEWLGPKLSAAAEIGREKLSQLAEWLGPKVTEAAALFTDWLDANRPKIEDFFTVTADVAQALWDNFKAGTEEVIPILETLGGLFFDLGTWLVTNKPIMIGVFGAIGAAIVLALGPVSLAVLAILGVITVVGYLKDNWRDVLDFIKEKVAAFVGFLDSPKGLAALAILLGPAGLILGAVVHFRDEIAAAIQFVAGKIEWLIEKIASIPKPDLGFLGDIAGGIGSAAGKIGGLLGGGNTVGGNIVTKVPGMATQVNRTGRYGFIPGSAASGQFGATTINNINVTQPLGTPDAIAGAVLGAIVQNERTGKMRVVTS